MIHMMEIPKVREYDSGTIRVVCKNPMGEAECSTTLLVIPHEDWRSRLKQAPKCKSCCVLVLRRSVMCIPVDIAVSQHLVDHHAMAEFAELFIGSFSGYCDHVQDYCLFSLYSVYKYLVKFMYPLSNPNLCIKMCNLCVLCQTPRCEIYVPLVKPEM